MRTLRDWLKYYNVLDVVPFVEAISNMRDFFAARGVDMFTDAVTIPGVAYAYAINGAIERGFEIWTLTAAEYALYKRNKIAGLL